MKKPLCSGFSKLMIDDGSSGGERRVVFTIMHLGTVFYGGLGACGCLGACHLWNS